VNIHCLQNVSFENPGTIAEWAALNHHAVSYTYFFENDFSFPPMENMDALLIMGGYMNVDEEEKFPWLKQEKQFIRAAIDAGKKVMGICLGSQLLAAACGSKVYPAKEKEIGFFPVQFTAEAMAHPLFIHFNNPCTIFHWHGDTFDLPDNALLIASTDSCKHQAYLIGNQVLGLQFHFEMNEAIIEDMLLHDGRELEEKGKYIQSKATIKNGYVHLKQNKKDMYLLLDNFFAV
jgi:GMP synthase-like glutamine amidotransferase